MVGVIWYRFVRCGGTDWSDTLVPIRPLQWYRFADIIRKEDSRYRNYENRIYLALAEKLVMYGWIMVTLTAASPLMDSSFFETGRTGGDLFPGFASVRCSELGYWNTFAPVFDYSSIGAYTRCIQSSMSMTDGLWLLRSSITPYA